MFKTSLFFKTFILIFILSLFFFAFSYLEKEQAKQEFNLLISQLIQANPEIIKTITYSDLNTNLLWAWQGKYEVTNLNIMTKNPLYQLTIGRIVLDQLQLQPVNNIHLKINDIFFKNLNILIPQLPSDFDLFLNLDIHYSNLNNPNLNNPNIKTQKLLIHLEIMDGLTPLQTRDYFYTSQNPSQDNLKTNLKTNLKIQGNDLLKIFNFSKPERSKITNNPDLNSSNLNKLNKANQKNKDKNTTQALYQITLQKELNNLNQLAYYFKIIQDSPAYQAALAYLQGDQSQILITRPS